MKNQFILGLLLGICLSTITLTPLLSANSNSSNIIKHTINDHLTLNIPDSTRVIENNIIGNGQLLYSIYLDDQTLLLRGYAQIWNLSNLENYLEESKKISTFDFNSYSLKPIEVGNYGGYLIKWTASFGVNYRISGIEYWLKKSDTSDVLRISFFTDTTSFTKEQIEYIDKIIGSLN
ncbi:hypothetical protein [Desulfitobacterium metallireducens]|uniref:Uncharacterized protein n=1 Tax=Desulfitobacterium metallireducens DSM 15288 TaxID=871968 RepID=W0E8N0_9FIRM|nr:hypothetical protein [Desulfitobacterium metallireducens]AHF07117.1 hypothetical protein DESME_08540 [Desulfitobacterium metallireducens DSM 15288]